MNPRSLRFRLAVWYFCTVAGIFAIAALGYWVTIRSALNYALDQGLRYRLIGLSRYIETTPAAVGDLPAKLAEASSLGDLFQVFDEGGRLIAQSDGLARHRVSDRPPAGLGFEIRYTTGGPGDFQLRHAWQRISLAGRPLILDVADPLRKYDGLRRAFNSMLLLSVPLILLLATVCGVWLGRLALAPVARITEDARAITESNLSARLAVPDSRDELQKLSETLNEMLARIERSFTRTRQFTADASHELRAPMTLIHTAAEHSLRRERSREDLLESLRRILREARRTNTLINDLLTLARGDADAGRPDLQPLNLASLLHDVADEGRPLISARELHFQLQIADPLPVLADEASLRRLLVILLDNAAKYTPAGGSVAIEADSAGSGVQVRVRDTGEGISAEDLPHVFERFWRADKARSRQAGGTGLGLAIARQIAERHGATLEASSSLGQGSVFTLTLPPVLP